MDFTGFKLRETSVKEIQFELENARQQITTIASKEFHSLLGEEIAFLLDCVTLGILNRTPEEDFYEISERNLRSKIFEWTQKNVTGKYNFAIYAYLFPYKKEVYMQVDVKNPVFLKAFSYLNDFSLNVCEMEDLNNPKTKIWKKIMEMGKPLITINLSPELKMERNDIIYPSKSERIQMWARHQITNERLKTYSGGQQIPPHLLMRYMDAALEDLDSYHEEIKDAEIKLGQILLDLQDEKTKEILQPQRKDKKEC